MCKKIIVLACIVSMSFAGYATAATAVATSWSNAVPDGSDWNTSGNWNNGVPVQNDPLGGPTAATFGKAGWKNNSTSPDMTGKTVGVDQIVVGGNKDHATLPGGFLTVAGGTLNVSEFGHIANVASESGILNINEGGTINFGTMIPSLGNLKVGKLGTGVLNMNGGTLNLTSFLTIAPDAATTANGLVNLNSGFIFATDLLMASGGLGTARMVVKDGFMIISNSTEAKAATIQGWIDGGWISGAAGYTPYVAFDAETATTTIWAEVPEPATICLLGLGVLGLIRRK